MRVTLRCTLSQSVLSENRCVRHDMLKTKKGSDKLSWDQTLSLDTTDTRIADKQTGIVRQPKLTSRKGEKQQRRRDASASGKE